MNRYLRLSRTCLSYLLARLQCRLLHLSCPRNLLLEIKVRASYHAFESRKCLRTFNRLCIFTEQRLQFPKKKIVRFVTRTFPRNFRSKDPTTMVGIVSGELRRVFSLNADFSRHYSRADTVYASSVP